MNVLNHPALIALLQNAALLLALVVVFDLAAGRLPMRGRPLRQIAVGAVLGGLCVALIATAFRLESGIVFDTRSVLLSVSGLFFGALPTGVAMAITAAFRLFKGGVGAWTGVSVTLATGAIGIAWRHLRKGRLQDVSARELYAFGIAVHLVMLALMLTLPWPSARHVLRGIGLPVLLVYPVAATALGLLLANRLRREQAAADLAASEERFRSLVQLSPVPMGFIDAAGRVVLLNRRFTELFGYSAEDVPSLADWWRRAYPDEAYRREVVRTWSAALEKAVREKSVAEPAEFRVTCKNGELRDVEISGTGIDGGTLTCFADLTERRRAEAALRESEARLRLFIEHAPASLAMFDRDLRYLAVSRRWLADFGLEGRDLLGRLHYDVFPEIGENLRQIHRRGLAGEVVQGNEDPFVRADGHVQYVRWEIHPWRDDRGEIGGIVIFTEDVAPRKQAEARIQSTLAFLDRVIDMSPFAMWIADRNGLVTRVNRALCSIIHLAPDQVAGHYNVLADANLEAQGVMPQVRAVFEKHVPARFCIPWQAAAAGDVDFRGARDLYVDVALFPIVNAQDELTHVVCQWVDVTQQKQAERALRESEERFRMLVDGAPEGIFVQADGRFLFVNPALVRMLGAAKAEDLVGTDSLARIAPEYQAAVRDRIRRQRETGQLVSPMEQEYLRLDGGRVPVETTAVPVKFSGRDAHLVFVRDTSERQRIEQEKQNLQTQLAQAQKMDSIGRLAGGVAHDFNNMLGVILGQAELALDELEPASPLYAGLQEIRKAAIRSGDLTRQLLAFARKQTIAPRPLDLNETVEGMLQMLRRLIGENVELAWRPCPVSARVKMDPSQIDQILANLCVNARDAVGDKGHVAIETGLFDFDAAYCAAHAGYMPGRFVRLAVRDDGCGMDSQTLLRLFEPFFTTKEVGKGTGLGLATVYGIVKQNDGFIVVDSQPGQGSTFRIYLPLLRETGAAEAPAAPPPIPGGHETILLVEDEPALLNMTRRMLEQIGYRVLPAASPAEALRLAKRESGRIDLLMTDVVMPQMNGRNLGQILAEEIPGLKRLFMSGYTADVIAHHGVLDPGVHFIAKPFTPAELAHKLREILGADSPAAPRA